jgi:hypothetical protein
LSFFFFFFFVVLFALVFHDLVESKGGKEREDGEERE